VIQVSLWFYISVKVLRSSRENTHIVESLTKVCDTMMQNTTVQSEPMFIGIKNIKY